MAVRKASWYSIVRYTADEISGETVNVGIILHVLEESGDSQIKYLLLQENSSKVKAVTETTTDQQLYKSYKENLEYYLQQSTEDLFGTVGNISIGSPSDEKYLEMLFDFYGSEKLSITRPKFSLTKNVEGLFNNLFITYVGSKYLNYENSQVSTKRYIRELLVENNLLDKKVISDHVISPIEELKNIEIKIDFCFKNGVMNYMQGVPILKGPSQNTEWFTKTKFMIDNVDRDSKVQLLYRNYDKINEDLNDMIGYFNSSGINVVKVNLDNKSEVDTLINKIATEAQDVDELMIS